jgi:hypothetical protein
MSGIVDPVTPVGGRPMTPEAGIASRRSIERAIASVYGRERLADSVMAVLEDVLHTLGRDGSGAARVATDAAIAQVVQDVTGVASVRLVERLTGLLETTPLDRERHDRHAFDHG